MRKILKNIFVYYVGNNFHVGLAATALTYVSWQTQNVRPDKSTLFFVFSSVFLSYGFVKNFSSGTQLFKQKPLLVFFGCGIATYFIFYFFEAEVNTKVLIFLLAVLSGLYALPSRWFSQNLRNTPGWKSVAVALSWTGLIAGLGLTQGKLVADSDFLKWMLQLACLVWVWIIPFDIRDLATDKVELQTLPQKWGVVSTKWVGTGVLFVVVVIEWSKKINLSLHLLFSVLLTLLFLWTASKKQSEYFASFWVESIPIFWFFSVCIV